jgi:NADPH:quinone reductase-like Zn-dependent oxidoreductase
MPRAVQFLEFGSASVLKVADVPEPHAGEGEVRVTVRSIGLNPLDSKVRSGEVQQFIPVRPPSGLGNEFAGVVDEVGSGVAGYEVGDEVFGAAPFRSLAEYVIAEPGQIFRKPVGLSFDIAAGIPIAGTTGYNSALAVGPHPGDTVLVSAAAGGVGGVAAQVARKSGAAVIGTASEANHAYLESIGVIPVTYGPGLAERVRRVAPSGLTATLENHDNEAIEAAFELGVSAARINTVVGNAAQYGVGAKGAATDSMTLAAVAELFVDGLSFPIQAVFALEDVVAAFERLESGHLRGKVIVRIGG